MNVVSALRRSFRRSSLRRNKSAENVGKDDTKDDTYDKGEGNRLPDASRGGVHAMLDAELLAPSSHTFNAGGNDAFRMVCLNEF